MICFFLFFFFIFIFSVLATVYGDTSKSLISFRIFLFFFPVGRDITTYYATNDEYLSPIFMKEMKSPIGGNNSFFACCLFIIPFLSSSVFCL